MVDLAATFEENAMEAAAMVWRCERTPLALRKAVGLAAHKARGIVLSEPEFLGEPLIAGLRGLAGFIPRPDDDELATADAGKLIGVLSVPSTAANGAGWYSGGTGSLGMPTSRRPARTPAADDPRREAQAAGL